MAYFLFGGVAVEFHWLSIHQILQQNEVEEKAVCFATQALLYRHMHAVCVCVCVCVCVN